MKRKYKILIIALAIVAILTIAIATTALAAPRGANQRVATPTEADYQAWGCPAANGNYSGVATLLGLTTDEIYTQLQEGKSLVEIAAAAPKKATEDQLVAAILEPMKQFMQQQVTAGNWTQDQLDARLKQAELHIRQLVNSKGLANGGVGCGGGGIGMMGGNTGYGMMGGSGGGMTGGWSTNRGASLSGNQGVVPGNRGYGMMGGRGGMMGGFGRAY